MSNLSTIGYKLYLILYGVIIARLWDAPTDFVHVALASFSVVVLFHSWNRLTGCF